MNKQLKREYRRLCIRRQRMAKMATCSHLRQSAKRVATLDKRLRVMEYVLGNGA